MSNCNNCFNGCVETVSDQCIRYTGIDVPTLGIHTGDPLSVIEQSLITFLLSTLDGSGIKIDLSSIDVCAVVQKYLPTCGEISMEDISKSLIESMCDIQDQVNSIFGTLAVLNSDYVIGCLTGVTNSSDTHAVVQATITKLCSVSASVTSILAQLPLFAKKSEICSLMTQCGISGGGSTLLASYRMVPYSPIPYYGAISNYPATGDSFDATGAGLNYWSRVFMCNGQNGTPDLRGRAAIGATNTPCEFPCSTETIPNGTTNPTYNKGDLRGDNAITLNATQIPSHAHANTISVSLTDPGHTHGLIAITSNGGTTNGYEHVNLGNVSTLQTENKTTGITASATITNANFGGDNWHSNVQPGLAVYYIMYIPA
jgi:microcystin-dependent protein